MNSPLPSLPFLSLFFRTLWCAQLEFVGYLHSPEGDRFVVREVESGVVSRWLSLGASYAGFTLLSHDRQLGILAIEGQGKRLELPLQSAHTLPLPNWKQKVGRVAVQFTGEAPVSADVVLRHLQTRAGSSLDQQALDQDMQTLSRLALFESVSVKTEAVDPDTIDVIITLVAKRPAADPTTPA